MRRSRSLALAPALVLAGALLASVSLYLSSCSLDGYCIDCAVNDDGGNSGSHDARSDGAIADAGDSGPRPDACIVTSAQEVCDEIDNDCDGQVDELPIDGVGNPCGTDVGECRSGTTECSGGRIVCGGGANPPTIEQCDALDHDCDGDPVNGNPGGGAICGTDSGECRSGITNCVGPPYSIQCVGEIPPALQETCNGLDDDCDNQFDEGVAPGGSCGPAEGNVGLCNLGVMQCLGGTFQCVGAVYPTIEQCDPDDHDCDGNPTNGFSFPSDPRNCGPAGDPTSCGHRCIDDLTAADPHVQSVICSNGGCAIGLCETDYHDNNGVFQDGCESGPCAIQGLADPCNLRDDDCDGMVDEDAVAPNFCDPDGECADPPNSGNRLAPTCTTSGWVCDYENHPSGGVVSTDGNHNIEPEGRCDTKDNDCDGQVDEGFGVGTNCSIVDGDGCTVSGAIACDGAGGTFCDTPPFTMGPEVCDGIDNDCNGIIDDGFATAPFDAHPWVDIGNGVQVLAFEASRPNASSGDPGTLESHVCAKTGVEPWTNLRYADAQAMCGTIGARLCTEAEWSRACATGPPTPINQVASANNLVVFEAEDFNANISNDGTGTCDGFAWIADTTSGYSGAGAMKADPDGNPTGGFNRGTSETNCPHLDYTVDFAVAGTYRVWVRGFADDTNDNQVHAAIDGSIPASADDIGSFVSNEWSWRGGGNFTITVPSTGVHTFSLFMDENGFIADKILLTTDANYQPTNRGPIGPCNWSYASDCQSYQANTCNGNDFDPIPGAPDDDLIRDCGAMANCYADWGGGNHIFDMSGNVKEWAEARVANQNPIRGGAYDTHGDGMSCGFDFTLADDTFFFPNVGFRCCR